MMSVMGITVSISVLKEIGSLNYITFKRANSIKYRDLMNTEKKHNLKIYANLYKL